MIGARTRHTQAANIQAKLATNALARLGGYFIEEGRTPVNATVQAACSSLLTPPLAKRLSRTAPDELLEVLNSHAETPTVRAVGPPCRGGLPALTATGLHRCTGPTACGKR